MPFISHKALELLENKNLTKIMGMISGSDLGVIRCVSVIIQKCIFSSRKKSQVQWNETNIVDKRDALSTLQSSCLAEVFANSFNPKHCLENSQLVVNLIFYKAVKLKEIVKLGFHCDGKLFLQRASCFSCTTESILLSLPFNSQALFFCQKVIWP